MIEMNLIVVFAGTLWSSFGEIFKFYILCMLQEFCATK